jgi:hypothetical protein
MPEYRSRVIAGNVVVIVDRSGPGNAVMKIVRARAPSGDGGIIPVTIDPSHLRVLLEAGRLTALGELVGLIIQDSVLEMPTGIFKGLRRPLLREGVDDFVFAYVTRPSLTYKFALGARNDHHTPDKLIAQDDSVFVIFVTLSRDIINEVAMTYEEAQCRGVVLGWEWTCADPDDPNLPEQADKRYRRRIWKSS